MKEHSIYFPKKIAYMQIKGILDGSVTILRFPINPQPFIANGAWQWYHKFFTKSKFDEWDTGRTGFYLDLDADEETFAFFNFLIEVCCPYGTVGDRLWVKETFRVASVGCMCSECKKELIMIEYPIPDSYGYTDTKRALLNKENKNKADEIYKRCNGGKYCPSIHMPRWASRITLEITGVRVEENSENICERIIEFKKITRGE